MITVNTEVYTQKPVNDGLYVQNSTHTVNSLNLTVGTLGGKPKSKQRQKPYKWDHRACKSMINRIYAGKTLKSDYTRKTQWMLDYTTKEQRFKWKSASSGIYAWKPWNWIIRAKPVNIRLYTKHSAISKHHEVQLFELAIPVEETKNKAKEHKSLIDKQPWGSAV